MPSQIKTIQTNEPELAANFIASQILSQLQAGRRVLWFVSGGSAIAVAVSAAEKIAKFPHHSLVVTLTDERYGPLNHQDSNWRQLLEAGFKLPEARLISVLTGADFLATAQIFSEKLRTEETLADYKIGLFGIGPDGHTAGILPDSPAVSASGLVSAYEAGIFKRITITPAAILKLDEGIVFATGPVKWPVLKRLDEELEITNQPAQVLKHLAKLTIFTDYKN